MALTQEARESILNRALRLESRSFLEYMALTAPPIDLAKFPAVARGLIDIAREEDEVVDELVETLEEGGAHAEALGSYDLTFTYYNYITTDYALKEIEKHLAKNVARFDELLAEAKGDALEARLRELRERKADQVRKIAELRAGLKKPAAEKAAPAPAAAEAHGHAAKH
jgi:hypothetical protein